MTKRKKTAGEEKAACKHSIGKLIVTSVPHDVLASEYRGLPVVCTCYDCDQELNEDDVRTLLVSHCEGLMSDRQTALKERIRSALAIVSVLSAEMPPSIVVAGLRFASSIAELDIEEPR